MKDEPVRVTENDRITDIAGLAVGNAHGDAERSGVTVLLPGAEAGHAFVMGVDVRGGAPGTRDTTALDPSCLVDAFHGLVLAGGSVFGLAAADGVTNWLAAQGRGLALGPCTVPVVPAAILFDLANGGDKNWGGTPPYAAWGRAAASAAGRDFAQGRAGAGYGTVAGDRRGGLGSAASVAADAGYTVGALVAVNAFGPPLDTDMSRVPMPKPAFIAENTTIAAVATDLALDKAQCRRLAIMAQDGLARALRPVHTPFDGDTVFAVATGRAAPTEPLGRTLTVAGTLAADTLTRAVEKALAQAIQ